MTQGRSSPLHRAGPVTGPGAGAIKYDILTALLAMANAGDPVEARLALRLSLLITARFNWRHGSFAVGQAEMARMWGVTERTAKREVAALRARGWIVLAVPAARGRVAQYRIDLPGLLAATMPHWDAVGPDFVARMTDTPPPADSNVVPLRPAALPEIDSGDETGWSAAAARLARDDSTLFRAWIADLVPEDRVGGRLTLLARSRFAADYVATHHTTRILAALAAEGCGVSELRILSPEGARS